MSKEEVGQARQPYDNPVTEEELLEYFGEYDPNAPVFELIISKEAEQSFGLTTRRTGLH